MPHSLSVSEIEKLIRVRISGDRNSAEWVDLITTIAQAVEGRPDWGILADLRENRSLPTPAIIQQLVQQIGTDYPDFRGRVALWTLPGMKYNLARLFASTAKMKGHSVGAFLEEIEALSWLKRKVSAHPRR